MRLYMKLCDINWPRAERIFGYLKLVRNTRFTVTPNNYNQVGITFRII